MWSDKNSHLLLKDEQMVQATVKDSLTVSFKTKYTPIYDPAITCHDIYPNELKTCVQTKTCT